MEKILLLRLNLDLDNKEIKGSLRLRRAADSVKSASKKFSKIIILSHRGRPSGIDKKLSLKPVAEELSKALKKKIIFISRFDAALIKKEVVSAKKGTWMLENIRFLPGEYENDPALSKELASLGDIFINDDFATAHRANASNVGIAKFIKKAVAGPIMKAEIESIKKAMKKPKHPFTIVIGGVKMKDKIGVIRLLLPKADNILLGGGPANTALKAEGFDIGSSIYDAEMIDEVRELLDNPKIFVPLDTIIANDEILDIGPNTADQYADIIKNSGTVIWAGPMGRFEKKKFANGSYAVAKAAAASRAFSLAGGGETLAVIKELGIEKKIGFVSTGGGAMLVLLSGGEMPAFEALGIK